MNLEEVYPNSPLIEVVCELRFQRNLEIECRRSVYYERIKEKYPNILLPHLPPGGAPALLQYRFENKENDAGILLSIDKFSHYDKKYKGHKKFISEFLNSWQALSDTYKIEEPTRLGWRYINVIPFGREGGLVPLADFFTFQLNFPDTNGSDFENLDMTFVTRVKEGSITTKLQTAIESKTRQEVFILDIDFGMKENLSIKNIDKSVQHAHVEARSLFEKSITEKYRQYLRGEKV